ncbi:FMRFamide receptor [Biomphalaria glabrata]|nr:FMRFamide receptor-like [Biomphalaria glabrata]
MSLENTTKLTSPTIQLLVQQEAVTFFLTFNLLVCGEIIGVLGIVGNVINIVAFTKEGLQDSVNITLSALAVSDIGALLTQMVVNICFSPFWNGADIQYSSLVVFSTMFFYPREYFVRVSGLITAFATSERCMCVLLPLKVKGIITRKVAAVVVGSIFVVISAYMFPPYYVTYFDWGLDTKRNQTKILLLYRNNPETVLRVSYLITDMFVPYATFFILILCNAVIVVRLRSSWRWRRTVTSGKHSGSKEISGKEKKLVKMLTTVSIIFLLCLTPQSAMLTALGIVRELKINGPYFDLSLLVYSFTFLLETINCSVNIIVYYNMSSKFRERIQTWLPCLRRAKDIS